MAANESDVRGIAPPLYAVLALSGGVAQGIVVVTLTNLLPRHGVSVAVIAIMGALWVVPAACRFLVSPAVDLSLTPIRWCLISVAATVLAILALAIAPLTPAGMPLLCALVLVMGFAVAFGSVAVSAAMALTTPLEKRGAVAGWGNAGALGGTGLGGGLGIWLTGHAGGFGVATMVLAPITLLSALPLILFRLPPRIRPPGMRQKLGELGGALATLARSRGGVLALVVILLPACLGAAAGLFPAVAGGWRASNDLVALTAGVLAGIVVIPGAIVGGYLCDLFPRRPTYVAAAFVYAAAEAAMAFAPHTPTVFVVFLLLLAFLQGVGYAAVNAVILECLGVVAPATVSAVMGSVVNIPVVIGGALIGLVQTRYGSTWMLLAEAIVAVVVLALYSAWAWFWRATPAVVDEAAIVAV